MVVSAQKLVLTSFCSLSTSVKIRYNRPDNHREVLVVCQATDKMNVAVC